MHLIQRTQVFHTSSPQTDSGSHTFTGAIRLVTAGDQEVRVSAPNMQTATSIVNVTGQVTKLNFTAPATSTAGDSFNITVSAIDTTGSAASGYSSKIHFASSDALAGLPADYTFTPADAGVHTFYGDTQEVGGQSSLTQLRLEAESLVVPLSMSLRPQRRR